MTRRAPRTVAAAATVLAIALLTGAAAAPHSQPQPQRTCRESSRAWHRVAGDTLWFYILANRQTGRIDTQAVVFATDSAVQLRPRPRRLGPTQTGKLRAMRDKCAARPVDDSIPVPPGR